MDDKAPSALAIAFATAIVSGLAGYFLGQASTIGVFSSSSPANPIRSKSSKNSDPSASSDSSSEDDSLQSFASSKEECKLILVVRTDLGMTKGKIAAQCSHATLACYKSLNKTQPVLLQQWEKYGQAKVAVQVSSEADLEDLQAKAMSLGICAQVVHDAGRTQIKAGSATVLGVGPAPKSVVDQVTSHLKLL